MGNYYFFDKKINGRNLTEPEKSGIAYSMAAVLPAILSLIFVIVMLAFGQTSESVKGQDWYLYVTFLLPQIASALLIVWFVTFTKTPLVSATGVKKTGWQYYVLAVALQIGLLSLADLNVWFIEFLSEGGYAGQDLELPSMDGLGFIGVLFVIAVLPAILEECVFRGLVINGLKGIGTLGCCLLCGGLFAFYHQNPSQTIYQFICGSAFALVVLRSGSTLPTMLSHFINNALILTLTKLGVESMPVWFYILSGVCLVGSLAYLIFFDKPKPDVAQETVDKKHIFKQFLLCASVGLFIYVIVWVSALFA